MRVDVLRNRVDPSVELWGDCILGTEMYCTFGRLFLSMDCRDPALWEIFILSTIWTKYNSLRGGKKESRNRTDSFERANRSTNALPRLFLYDLSTNLDDDDLFYSFWTILLHSFLPSHIRLHFRLSQLRPICIYAPFWPFWGIFSVNRLFESLTHKTQKWITGEWPF